MNLFTKRSGRLSPPSLPLMPLIDIIFLILIFFVINVNLPPGGIEIDLPSSQSSQTKQQPDELVVTLSAKGEIFLNNKSTPLTRSRLQEVLQPYRNRLRSQVVRLRADRRLDYGSVIAVLDVLTQVSENISLETVADDLSR